jgi:maltose phosphorylase
MVTMNGEECHNEWEITFEEIHRNGAIAYAIFDYIDYTGDSAYLLEGGLEVLIGIARFWAQRVNWAEPLQKYVMLGVTGPNEYENNVDNNWYTNYIATWCLKYAAECIKNTNGQNDEILSKVDFKSEELTQWTKIADNMHFPADEARGIFLQQDNYLNKEQLTVDQIPADQRPLNQNWSWDRILRSCFIKQADVLQGLFFFEDHFDLETIRRNFDFYEPRTVHESSLSPCVHSILACRLDKPAKAYEMYLRTARLDLDDYNNDTDDGLHITSMAGTWMSIVQGFGGVRVLRNKLHITPSLPSQWTGMAFRIHFRGAILSTHVGRESIRIKNDSDIVSSIVIDGIEQVLKAGDEIELPVGLATT